MPDIGEMAGQSARNEEDGIDADVVAIASVAGCQALGGDDDAAKPIFVERQSGAFLRGARLDFDEGEDAAPARDQVDFAARDPGALGEDAPAMQPKPPGGDGLRLAAALLGDDPPVQRLSSRARA
jgi:hypothetical protein